VPCIDGHTRASAATPYHPSRCCYSHCFTASHPAVPFPVHPSAHTYRIHPPDPHLHPHPSRLPPTRCESPTRRAPREHPSASTIESAAPPLSTTGAGSLPAGRRGHTARGWRGNRRERRGFGAGGIYGGQVMQARWPGFELCVMVVWAVTRGQAGSVRFFWSTGRGSGSCTCAG
jgi:hypothetical protein